MADINDIMSNLNSRYEEITDLVPDMKVFMDDYAYAVNEYGQDMDDSPLGSQFYKLASGKYLWVGRDGSNTNINKNVRRYNSDLTWDQTFNCVNFGGNENGFVRSVAEQSDGKIVVVGHFTDVGGNSINGICRLNSDGSLDETFISGIGFNGNALVVRVLGDDSLLVGGAFNLYNNVIVNRLIRLSPDGELDAVFSENVTFSNTVHEIFVDSATGKIYVGGQFSGSMARLNSDGTVDETFSVQFNSRVTSIKKDSSGKLMVGGWFDTCNSAPCSRGIVRLENTGSLDESFATEGAGLNNTEGVVQSVEMQPNGKIIVAGWFNEYNGERSGHLIRLNSDGTKDSSFAVGYGFSSDTDSWNGGRVMHVSLDSSGNVLCVGSFTHYNGSPRYGFAKLNSSAVVQREMLFKYPLTVGISDGGNDMYDTGNFLNTNLTQSYQDILDGGLQRPLSIPNTHSPIDDEQDLELEGAPLYAPVMDGEVRSGDGYFGEGSGYFTNMYPGLFVMVATNMDIEEFSITGGLGSDGDTQNAKSVVVIHEGATYTVFLKVNREGEGGESGGDPSVNHIIIVPGEPDGLTHLANDDGEDDDDDGVQGLSGRSSIAYLVVARSNADYLSDEDAVAVAVKFLEVSGGLSSTQTFSATGGSSYDLSPQFVRQVGEGSLDTAIVVEEGERISLQRTGYYETVDSQGNRKVVMVNDGETWDDAPEAPESTSNPNGHPTFGANDVPSVTSQVIPAGNPLSN